MLNIWNVLFGGRLIYGHDIIGNPARAYRCGTIFNAVALHFDKDDECRTKTLTEIKTAKSECANEETATNKHAALAAWTSSLPMQSRALRSSRKTRIKLMGTQLPRSTQKAWY